MNSILTEIQKIIHNGISSHLPHVKSSDLEKKGAVFYMNGQNGTEFDWHVNEKFPPFMVFYDDKENLGAAKLLLYSSGQVELYLYGEQGKKLIQTVSTTISANSGELLQLAVTLCNEADNKRFWDGDIAEINTDAPASPAQLDAFQSREKDYMTTKNRKKLLMLTAYVSKKITEEGWKIGYLERQEPVNERDSGWFLASGTEDDAYLSDYKNIELLPLGIVWQQLDPDIFKYIDMPVGTKLIRTSPENFEADNNSKAIYTIKR